MTAFTYEENNAIRVIRKSMRNKPGIVAEILKDAPYAAAEAVLLAAKKETEQLLHVTKAFVAAASVLASKQQQERSDDATESTNQP
jgi:hypothetical protein